MNASKRSKPRALAELTSLLEEKWDDEDSRVSVTVVAAQPAPTTPSLAPKVAKRVATLIAAIIMGLVTAWTTLRETGVIK